MGKVRFRKSINLGGGARLNLSSKGVGASFGVKGMRVSRSADGKTRYTASIPGSGLSYQHVSGSKRRAAPSRRTSGATVGTPRRPGGVLPVILNLFLPGVALFFVRNPLGAVAWLLTAIISAGAGWSFLLLLAWVGSFVHFFMARAGRTLASFSQPSAPQGPTPEEIAEVEAIRAGRLPSCASGAFLDAGEVCHLETPAFYQRPLKSGVRTTQGTLTVTGTQIIFSGQDGGWNVNLGRVLSVKALPGGFDLTTSVQRGNGFYEVPQPERSAAIIETAVKLSKRLMLMPEDGQQTRHIPQAVKTAVWQRDQGQCVQCGAADYLEFDHVIPHSKGGANTEGNVQLLCRRCNLAKSDRI